MQKSNPLPPIPAHLEALLLGFDASWNNPGVEQLRAAFPAEADDAYLLELIQIDVQKRRVAGLPVDEALYVEAFALLRDKGELLQKVREITFSPMQAGDSVLRALAATIPVLPQVNLPVADPEATRSELAESSKLPEHRYRLEGEIARGGMGAVLRGRDEDLGREIAVKVMLQNHAGKTELLQRFVEEAQIAGQLQHPGITPVYELGRFPDQRPYFTMKLVRGQTLAKLLKDRSDAASERPRFLKVFEQICQTLAYAHARKVLHRDLKPHNIMVGSFGEVQVMDWGLAKVLAAPAVKGEDSTHRTEIQDKREGSVQTKRSSGKSTDIPNTQAGSVLGTPAYMAPEQARGEIDQLDERADVFGLGAILCEILTGLPPYTGESGMEVYRKAVDADLADAEARLQGCGADPELISLAQRCLSSSREGRPRDASELTKELTGYLHSVEERLKQAELTAVKATTKAEEESKRRRVTFRLAAGILLTLVAGLAGSLWQMNRAMLAEGEERRAKEEVSRKADQLEKSNELLAGVFTDLDLRKVNEKEISLPVLLKQKLLKAVDQLKGDKAGDPLMVAKVQNQLGVALMNLGEHATAIELIKSSLAQRESSLGADHLDTLTSLNYLAMVYQLAELREKALPLYEKSFEKHKAILGGDHLNTLASMNNLAGIYMETRNLDKGMSLLESSVKILQGKYGTEHPDTIRAMMNLAACYRRARKYEKALPLFGETLKLAREKLGGDHPDTLNCLVNLAEMHRTTGNYSQAYPLFEEAISGQTSGLGMDHPTTLATMEKSAECYREGGKISLALPLYEKALQLKKSKFGPDHPLTLKGMNYLALGYQTAQQLEKAVPLYHDTLKLMQEKLGASHRDTLTCMGNLANAYQDLDQPDQALPLHEKSLKLREATLGKDHAETLIGMNNLAECYREAGKPDQALPLFLDALKRQKTRFGIDHPYTLSCMNNLALCYRALGKLELGIPLLEETVKLRQAKLHSTHPDVLQSKGSLAVFYLENQQHKKALDLLNAVYVSSKATFGEKHPETYRAMNQLGLAYAADRQGAKAVALFQDVIAFERTRHPKQDIRFGNLLAKLSQSMLECGQYSAAEVVLRECITIRQNKEPDAWTTFHIQSMLGAALLGQKQYETCEAQLLQGYEGLKKREKTIPPAARIRLAEALDRLIQLYTETNKPAEVKKWQAEKERLKQS